MNDDLPMGWDRCDLGTVISVKNGYAFKSSDYSTEGIPLVRISDIQEGKVNLKNSVFIPKEKANLDFTVQNGDLLIAMSGATTGKVGIYTGREICLQNQRVGNFKVLSHKLLNTRFRDFYVLSLSKNIEDAAYGGAQPNISSSVLESLEISLPPLNEQRRIVDKLERIGDRNRTARNELNHIPKLIARYKQAVLAAACSGKLTEDWREANLDKHNLLAYPQNTQDKTSKISQTELSMSEDLYEIPQSWVWKSLSNVCLKITDGEHLTPPLSSEGIPLLSAKDVRNDYLDFSETKYISLEVANKSRSRCNPEIEDILVVSRGATIGRTCRVKTNKLFCLMGSVLLFKINTTIAASCFVELFLKSSFSADRFLSMSGASAQSAIYIRDMKIFPIPIPPLEEQKEIVRRVEKMFAEIDKMEAEYQKAAKLCDRLEQATLAKAFRGELVPQHPDDEPASVLLEQVKREKQVQPKGKSVKSK